MYAINVRPETFDSNTIEVEINNKVERVACSKVGEKIVLMGIAVRYRTGNKIARATAVYWPATGAVNNLRPTIDHRQTRPNVFCVGFYSDFSEQKQSQRTGA